MVIDFFPEFQACRRDWLETEQGQIFVSRMGHLCEDKLFVFFWLYAKTGFVVTRQN